MTVWLLTSGNYDTQLPYLCAPGLIASKQPDEQASPRCGGACFSGYYCDGGANEPVICAAGQFCPLGSARGILCNPGTYNPMLGSASEDACLICPIGHFCPSGSATPTKCSPGSYATGEGNHECTMCEAGTYQMAAGMTQCIECGPGNFTSNVVSCERACLRDPTCRQRRHNIASATD